MFTTFYSRMFWQLSLSTSISHLQQKENDNDKYGIVTFIGNMPLDISYGHLQAHVYLMLNFMTLSFIPGTKCSKSMLTWCQSYRCITEMVPILKHNSVFLVLSSLKTSSWWEKCDTSSVPIDSSTEDTFALAMCHQTIIWIHLLFTSILTDKSNKWKKTNGTIKHKDFNILLLGWVFKQVSLLESSLLKSSLTFVP